MFRYIFALLPFFLFNFNFGSCSNGVKAQGNPDDLQPTASQQQVEELVTRFLTTYHYRKVPLNDSLSSVILDNYLKEVDGGHNYLLASDVQSFEKYRYSLDDQLQDGDLSAAYEIFNRFRQRVKERNSTITLLLNKPFDYSLDETLDTDREKAKYATTQAELDDLWRKIIKNQSLEMKLSGKADTATARLLKDRYKIFEKQFTKTKSEDVFQMFMNAFAECIDPHTNYFIPKTASNFNMEMSQSLEGIGALLQYENEYTKIKEIVPGGPAFKDGRLKPDDRIVAIAQGDDGQMKDVVGWFTDEVVQLIRGSKGTVVRLQVLPASSPAGSPAKEVRLVREKIKLEDQVARKNTINIEQNGKFYKIGIVDIPMFYRDFAGAQQREADFKSTTRDVSKIIDSLKQEKVDGILIDLRNNGGGSLVEAVSLTGLFISKGPVVQRRDGTGNISVEKDDDSNVYYNGPLGVVVNRYSASASEIFAAAIQDYKRGVIIGEQTYGKGTVQSLIDLGQFMKGEKPGQLKMTVEKFYRITGSSTQHKGVMPDVELPSDTDADDTGESALPSALPWDQIRTTVFIPTDIVTPVDIIRLQNQHQERLKTNPELKKWQDQLAEMKIWRAKTVVSLQESKRKTEREIREKLLKFWNSDDLVANNITDIKEHINAGGSVSELNDKKAEKKIVSAKIPAKVKRKDISLTESGRILAGLVNIK